MENIEKRKIDSLFVHTGDLKFDYRLSISLELVSNENPARFENKTPEVERYKNRTSIIHDKTSTRFDLTKVKQFSKVRNSNQTDDVEQLEAELEIDMPKLLHAFDNLDKDSFTFEDMSETLLDNARVLNRKLD
jgi:polynucleotide 5'-triphosphatase